MERQFQANLHQDKTGIWFTESDLAGVPADFLERLKRGDGTDTGMKWLPMKLPFLNTVLKYALKESTRRRAFTFYQNRLNDKNVLLHREMVLLKDDLARQLGYVNHAAFKAWTRMVNSPQAILSFLDEIRPALIAKGKEEVAKLLKLKQHVEPNAEHVFYWDNLLFQRIADEDQASVDFLHVADYFELRETLRSLMAIYEHIFGLKFQEITNQIADAMLGSRARFLKVHEDCLVFSLWESDSSSYHRIYVLRLLPTRWQVYAQRPLHVSAGKKRPLNVLKCCVNERNY